ncbi:glycosyltransferase [Cohnella sp. CFH 77786]|uniref:glycosyltransferase family 2 protein n=1 Tax=Cohnella sp. CFH 77786 TaxID=2662265 RepID=UPI001C60CB47|nr:glycosyltransferase family A protein [Cohnella sp. CFH 77786]MBW5446516.1 glycosyltransferase [Cohnella sp. CFH 77786]
MPKVTILMPTYNSANYIEESVNSMLNQTFQDFELLIIDDGSQDGTWQYLERLNNPRVRLVRHLENKGVVYSLNEGIGLSTGIYIARMDADDVSVPHRLERQIAYLDANPDVGVLGGMMQWIHNGQFQPKPCTHDGIRCWQLFHTSLSHPTLMMRRSVLEFHQMRYNPYFVHAEDYEFWNRMGEVTRLANLPEVLLHYRYHEGQVSNVYREVQEYNARRIRLIQLSKIGIFPSEEEYKTHLQFVYFAIPVYDYYEYSKAQAWMAKILHHNQAAGGYYDQQTLHRVLIRCFENSVDLPVWCYGTD